MAISETIGQGWRAIPTQRSKASDVLTSTLAWRQRVQFPSRFLTLLLWWQEGYFVMDACISSHPKKYSRRWGI